MKKSTKFIILSISLTVFVLAPNHSNITQAQYVGGVSVQTNSATNISSYQANLNGNLSIPYISNSNYVWFQWGTDTNYYNTTPQQYLNSGSFSQNISGLSANTTYHFRAVAQGNFGTVYGQDMTFYASNFNYGNCSYHSYQSCSGNNLYWYDSCGSQQEVSQYCTNGCYNNSCNYNNNNNYNNNCTYHAYRLCAGNNIYWYDSCGTQQDLFYACISGQTCQYGQCVAYVQPPVRPNSYNPYSQKACYLGSVYWFDSLGVRSGLYKSCNDNNDCTQDSCAGSQCVNTEKTNCSSEADNNQNNCGNGLCEIGAGETDTNCPVDCQTKPANRLVISIFTRSNPTSEQWQKATQTNANSKAYFMISVINNSSTQIDNVKISINKPEEISAIENLQLDGIGFSGDLNVGINIGSIAPLSMKLITFEGKTQSIASAINKEIIAKGEVSGAIQSDSVYINFNVGQNPAPAAISQTDTTGGIINFLKRWYMWILAGLVIISLFIIVFRRFSSEA